MPFLPPNQQRKALRSHSRKLISIDGNLVTTTDPRRQYKTPLKFLTAAAERNYVETCWHTTLGLRDIDKLDERRVLLVE